jgi:hypothetical protein
MRLSAEHPPVKSSPEDPERTMVHQAKSLRDLIRVRQPVLFVGVSHEIVEMVSVPPNLLPLTYQVLQWLSLELLAVACFFE